MTVYTVTAVEICSDGRIKHHCIGYNTNKSDAEWEIDRYKPVSVDDKYLVIEEYREGLLPQARSESWYAYSLEDNEYKPCDKPLYLVENKVVNFAIG